MKATSLLSGRTVVKAKKTTFLLSSAIPRVAALLPKAMEY